MKLTAEERRRMFEVQQKAREDMLAQPQSTSPETGTSAESRRVIQRLIETVMIMLLLGGGLLAYQAFEFHLPHSLMEALLPRL